MAKFTKTTKIIHWVSAVIALTMLSASFFLADLPANIQATGYMIHKSFGLIMLSLVIFRIIWVLKTVRPAGSISIHNWPKHIGRIMQRCLYILLLIMPFSGWIMATASGRVPKLFGLVLVPCPFIPHNSQLATFMNSVHKSVAWLLIIFVIAHIVWALKHHLVNKDNLLRRMWF